jgi:UDP-N-acetylmuramate: L-alanyl-gamma-D-glutamyl-meso-diaminopimelate ligase
MHYHLIGIAGSAMASLAGLLKERGHTVTGSDAGVYPPMSTMLDELEIPYVRGYDPANLEPTPDVVVVGNAISRGNEELEAVLDRRLHYTSAASLVKEEFLRGRHVVAVAGTHGKTTTTSLVTWILECAGLAPSFLIGGVAENFGRSFRLTEAEHFVIEADEYDTAYFDKGPKMWHYLPHTAVVTNVEFDHADIYRDDVAYRFVFERFVNLVPRTGTLVVGWDSPSARELSAGSLAPVESFGLGAAPATGLAGRVTRATEGEPTGPGPEQAGASAAESTSASGRPPRWTARHITYGAEGTGFLVYHDDSLLGEVETPLSGALNVQNCLAAIAAATAAGADWASVVEGMRTFESVRRRMEIRGEVRGVTVIDDFAHHPTSVEETIGAVRQRFPDRRVIAVFEPRSYTAQLRDFQEAYRRALAGADRVVLSGLFRPERYDADTGMDPGELAGSLEAGGIEADYVADVDEIVASLAQSTLSGDVVLIMSNGGFGGIHEKLLEALARTDSV